MQNTIIAFYLRVQCSCLSNCGTIHAMFSVLLQLAGRRETRHWCPQLCRVLSKTIIIEMNKGQTGNDIYMNFTRKANKAQWTPCPIRMVLSHISSINFCWTSPKNKYKYVNNTNEIFIVYIKKDERKVYLMVGSTFSKSKMDIPMIRVSK